MREILFRGKRTVNGKWVEGYAFKQRNPENIEESYIRVHETDFNVIPETVSQFTGLADKNGRKIFEGDIVRYGDGIYRVIFEQRNGTAYFGIAISEIETWYFGNNVPAKQMEVIGNICDNPELLEVKQNEMRLLSVMPNS